MLAALSRSPDPDLALRGLDRLREAVGDRGRSCPAALHEDVVLRGRLLAVLGSSTALSDFLVANPDRWRGARPYAAFDVDVACELPAEACCGPSTGRCCG